MSSTKSKKIQQFSTELLSRPQTAEFLGISMTQFRQAEPHLIARGRLVPVVVGLSVKYRREKIIQSIEACEASGEPFYDAKWNEAV